MHSKCDSTGKAICFETSCAPLNTPPPSTAKLIGAAYNSRGQVHSLPVILPGSDGKPVSIEDVNSHLHENFMDIHSYALALPQDFIQPKYDRLPFRYRTEVPKRLPICVKCVSPQNQDGLLFCADCGNAYHCGCLESPILKRSLASRFKWQCSDCRSCSTCATDLRKEDLLTCVGCDRGFHWFCLGLPEEDIPENSKILCVECLTPGASVSCYICSNPLPNTDIVCTRCRNSMHAECAKVTAGEVFVCISCRDDPEVVRTASTEEEVMTYCGDNEESKPSCRNPGWLNMELLNEVVNGDILDVTDMLGIDAEEEEVSQEPDSKRQKQEEE